MRGGVRNFGFAIGDFGLGVLAHGHWGKVQSSEFRVPSRRVLGSSGFKRRKPLLLGIARFAFWSAGTGHRLELKKGNKVNLELQTRSQGQSNLVKPSQT